MSLIVHGFAPLNEKLASPSPFCLKLETWLRLAGVAYQTRADFNPMKAPKGKAPWVEFDDGTKVGDSTLIIAEIERRMGVSLDAHLDEATRRRHILVQRTLEDHLYFCVLHMRWVRESGFAVLKTAYFGKAPALMRLIVPSMARRGVVKACRAQGIGRHSDADVDEAARVDIAALAEALGDAPFFGGEAPCTLDATAWGLLANVLYGPFEDAMKEALSGQANLVAWCDRMVDRAWGSGG